MLISFTGLKKKHNMNIRGIIHIGGHYGEEISEYIDNGIQNIIIFEPLENNFKVLEENLSNLNANIEGYQVALGSQKGFVDMYLSDNDAQSSSILKPKKHLTDHPHVKFEGVEKVEMDCLDNYDIHDYNFINIDVQGYELEVFRGSKKSLEQIDYIYCEVNRDEVYENNTMIDDLDSFLSDYNFNRVETYWPEPWYKWGDALYIKNIGN